jgi:hypothetical protein
MKVHNRKTKEEHKQIRNVIACGCAGNHDAANDDCEYNLVRLLLENVPDELAKTSLWWNATSNKWNRTQGKAGMKQTTMALAMERINKRCYITPRRLTGNMGRKTLATFGRHVFGQDDAIIRDVGQWETAEHLETYMDPLFMNLERGCIVTRNFQQFEQGRYKPDIADSVGHHLSEIRKTLKQTDKWQKAV